MHVGFKANEWGTFMNRLLVGVVTAAGSLALAGGALVAAATDTTGASGSATFTWFIDGSS